MRLRKAVKGVLITRSWGCSGGKPTILWLEEKLLGWRQHGPQGTTLSWKGTPNAEFCSPSNPHQCASGHQKSVRWVDSFPKTFNALLYIFCGGKKSFKLQMEVNVKRTLFIDTALGSELLSDSSHGNCPWCLLCKGLNKSWFMLRRTVLYETS